MGIFEIGELVVIPFPYSDLSDSKMRPALIIADLKNDDFIMTQITSKNYNDNYSIKISNNDLCEGNLYFDSYIKYSKIFTANKALISKSIGKLNNSKFGDIIECIIELLNVKF
jgi:mRNA interferase MazF